MLAKKKLCCGQSYMVIFHGKNEFKIIKSFNKNGQTVDLCERTETFEIKLQARN